MAINITNETGTIKVGITEFYNQDGGKTALSPSTIYFNKAKADVTSESNFVILKDSSNIVYLLFSNITTPVGTDANDTANIIQAYIT